jgi:hypothetical protein
VTVLPDATLSFAGVNKLFATVTLVGPVGTTGRVGVVLVGVLLLPPHAVRETSPRHIVAARPRRLRATGDGVESVAGMMESSRERAPVGHGFDERSHP